MAGELPLSVRQVLKDFPSISLVRAHQIARDRALLRRRAARQAYRNRFGPLEAGGIGHSAQALVESFEGLD
ncbi:MAG: hypothetical protein J0I69_02940 [Altererythrobacter sp.]|nr:hypothetical protein [Altererythrobacter sp.]OJU60968.1 MAG: hypothetical protein BGO08_12655 [Altererythrobacter sp. 66-12]